MSRVFLWSLSGLFVSLSLGAAGPVAASLQVELVHQLGADKGEQLKRLVDKFNAQSKDGQIVVSERSWSEGGTPALTIVSETDEERFLSGKPRYRPLWQVMQGAGQPLKTLPVPKMMVPGPVDGANRLVALPVALSSPVAYFNKELLARNGMDPNDPPKTWRGWLEQLGKLAQAGNRCPMTVSEPVSTLLENASVWNGQAFTVGGKNEQLAANGLVQVKHIAMMTTWYKSGYLRYFGRGSEADQRFASGECAVLVGPSGAYPSLVREARFEVGVGPYPYHDDAYGAPRHTWADGPAMWVGANRSPAEYRLISRFVRFWLMPANQIDWQVNAGYLPLNSSGLIAVQGSELLKNELAAQRYAVAALTNKPVTGASAATSFSHRLGVRRVLAEEIESVFADKKPAKQGLDDAVQRIRAGEDGCCRALR